MNTAKHSLLVETWHYTDKTYGNSYYAGQVKLDGGVILSVPMSYGYGRQNEYDIHRILVSMGVLTVETETQSLERACVIEGFVCYLVRHENALRKDLKSFGENGQTVFYPMWVETVLHGAIYCDNCDSFHTAEQKECA